MPTDEGILLVRLQFLQNDEDIQTVANLQRQFRFDLLDPSKEGKTYQNFLDNLFQDPNARQWGSRLINTTNPNLQTPNDVVNALIGNVYFPLAAQIMRNGNPPTPDPDEWFLLQQLNMLPSSVNPKLNVFEYSKLPGGVVSSLDIQAKLGKEI